MPPDPRSAIQHILALGLDRWWSEDVPVLFPAYLAARVLTRRLRLLWQTVALSAATFPAVAMVGNLAAVREGKMSHPVFERLWVWGNLQNPALVTLPPRAVAAGYLAVLATGLIIGLPDGGPPPRRRPPLDLPRTAGDAMNWAAVLLAGTLAAALLGSLCRDASWLRWIEPLSAPASDPTLAAVAVATNGALFLGVELWLAARAGLFWPRLLFWRLLAAALAGTLTWVLSAI
jgi:hypothetical protein